MSILFSFFFSEKNASNGTSINLKKMWSVMVVRHLKHGEPNTQCWNEYFLRSPMWVSRGNINDNKRCWLLLYATLFARINLTWRVTWALPSIYSEHEEVAFLCKEVANTIYIHWRELRAQKKNFGMRLNNSDEPPVLELRRVGSTPSLPLLPSPT